MDKGDGAMKNIEIHDADHLVGAIFPQPTWRILFPNDDNSALISEQAIAEILMNTGFWDNDEDGK